MNRAKELSFWGMYVLLAYMPFHVFLSQSLSLVTGGLSVWENTKDLFTAFLLAVCVWAVWRERAHKNKIFSVLFWATTVYTLLHIVLYLLIRQTSFSVALLAITYNVRLLGYILIGASVGLLYGKSVRTNQIVKFIIIISTIICLLGVAQYLLPTDFLTHFGYSDARGAKPNFLIDSKADLPRVFSTLREPNSLGAFLIVPILFLTHRFFSNKKKILFGGLLLLHGLVLLLTFSRSAWIATFIAETIFLFSMYGKTAITFCKRHAAWIAAVILVLVGGVYMLKNQYFVQNTLFHGDENTVGEGSTNKHVGSIETGIKSIVDKPLGHGPGTAGPVSYHTDKPVIHENYYLQLGYELGVTGLLFFIAICVWLFIRLQRVASVEARVLYASLVGYAVCCLLLHTWTNEAVAVQWWMLTGLILVVQKKHLNSGIVSGNKSQ